MQMVANILLALFAVAAAGCWLMGLLSFFEMLSHRREGTSAFQLATMWLSAGEESLTERGMAAKSKMLRYVGIFVLLIVVAAAVGVLGGVFTNKS